MKRIATIIFVLTVLAGALQAEDLNVTPSPDSTMVAFTRDGNLWVRHIADGKETRITDDATPLVQNGYASWVYYEEIFGRQSRYKAFWWSPDSRKLAFYRFDNSGVSMFPIFSPFGQNGSLNETRYPKAGQRNPSVKVAVADLHSGSVVWADFDEEQDPYFGTPFWDNDSASLYVQWMLRRQSCLDVYKVSAADGSKVLIYHDEYHSWVNWIEGMLFDGKGLYMARDSKTGWEQIYYLPFDGSGARMLTEGRNWSIRLLRLDKKKSDLWFLAKRDSRLHPGVYRLDRRGRITALTDPDMYVQEVKFADDGKTFSFRASNARTPWKMMTGDSYRYRCTVDSEEQVAAEGEPLPQIVKIENDGFDLYGLISYPKDFDASKKYPVVMQLYGGPGTPYVRDRWHDRDASDRWCWENGIIYIVVDPRSSGENGRRGMDQAFRRMTVIELQDYIAWAKWLQGLGCVSKIGVEGFSFGGTTTAMLVMRYPEYFHCGIAGGGVYDWRLYDSHYTERFMDTPQVNPDGYDEASPIRFVSSARKRLPLKLTHGTGDDNVHFQNTLQLVDALQKEGVQFELMIYPDGMHGYRGAQKAHSDTADHDFWTKWLMN